MKATNREGHEWQGDQDGPWFMYADEKGNLYESKEAPAYRIVMDNAQITKEGIMPI